MDELKLAYTTPLGRAYQGDSRKLLENLEHVPDESIDLIVTSPPFALTRKKSYGNEEASEFVDWFKTFLPGFKRVLSQSGSLVIDIGGAYLPGSPRRSTYQFQLAIEIDKVLPMCQEFFWFNPAKLPSLQSGSMSVEFESRTVSIWFFGLPRIQAIRRPIIAKY